MRTQSSRLPGHFQGNEVGDPPPATPLTIVGAVMSPASPWCTERGGAWNEAAS